MCKGNVAEEAAVSVDTVAYQRTHLGKANLRKLHDRSEQAGVRHVFHRVLANRMLKILVRRSGKISPSKSCMPQAPIQILDRCAGQSAIYNEDHAAIDTACTYHLGSWQPHGFSYSCSQICKNLFVLSLLLNNAGRARLHFRKRCLCHWRGCYTQWPVEVSLLSRSGLLLTRNHVLNGPMKKSVAFAWERNGIFYLSLPS
mmetsp:Transcript_68365/g.164055  ORF Transcript_68365/g.164055 Transcript_68365/m.164055 type:complete len:200 (-) Transcript_68365:32-631(-)